MEATNSSRDDRSLSKVRILVALSIASALVAAVAGVVLWLMAPDAGSSLDAGLGLTAALSGLAAGLLAAAAAIYAQIKNLWRYAPMWFRMAVLILVAVAIVRTLIGWLQTV